MNFCREIFHEIFHEIFLKYFKNFTMFFRLYTHPFNIFLYVKHYLSFMYAYCSSLSLSEGLLAWFSNFSFHTIDIEIFCRMKDYAGSQIDCVQAVLCIVHCNKISKPVKGKYLLLCMNSIMYLLLT